MTESYTNQVEAEDCDTPTSEI